MSKNPALQEAWASRHASDATLKASRKAFGSAVEDCSKLLAHNHDDLSNWLRTLYQSTIDYGAHPNVRSVFPHIDIEDGGSDWTMNLICLYDRAHPKHESGIVLASEVGLLASVLVALSVPDHPMTRDFARFQQLHERLATVAGPNEDAQKAQVD